jgi:hypothetical protein
LNINLGIKNERHDYKIGRVFVGGVFVGEEGERRR